jgi:hypothetical protein
MTKRERTINQLVAALVHHREHPPQFTDRKYCADLGRRFGIHPKSMEAAIHTAATTTIRKDDTK